MDKSKIHFLWIVIVFVAIILAIIFMLTLNKQKCNVPYIQVGTSCCLDENSNNICDNDEKIVELQDSCGDGLCQSNEKAPDCSDCKPNIKIENLQYDMIKPNPYVDSENAELELTNYDIIQMGDPVIIYPSLNIYQGISEEQCKNKNLMSLFKENLICQKGCSSFISKESAYYNLKSQYQLDGLNLNYSCIYFIFELKPYSETIINSSELSNIPSITKSESQIIKINVPQKTSLDIKNEQN